MLVTCENCQQGCAIWNWFKVIVHLLIFLGCRRDVSVVCLVLLSHIDNVVGFAVSGWWHLPVVVNVAVVVAVVAVVFRY